MLNYKLVGDLDSLQTFLQHMEEIANYQPCVDKTASLLEQLIAIKPQKGKLMMYSRYSDKWEAIYARLDENLLEFIKQHKHETIIRIKGHSISFACRYRKITVTLSLTPKQFDDDKAWSYDFIWPS